MTVVIDASVVVAGLASADSTGQWAESVLAGEPLAAPHLMPVEAASARSALRLLPAAPGLRGRMAQRPLAWRHILARRG